MQETPILSLEQSNNIIKMLINLNKSFSIVRIGNSEANASLAILNKKRPNQKELYDLENNAGIYFTSEKHIEIYAKHYNSAIEKANYMACFDKLYVNQQNEYLRKWSKQSLHYKVLEPYYCIEQGIAPWSHLLVDKTILIINPFVDTFKKQVENKFHFYGPEAPEEKRMFHKDQKFVFYKSYSTLGGNHIHNNWYQTFGIMCNDIKQLDFDIALIGCGGYGLPLCNYITSFGKSAIYVGGALQLLFGVNGRRWENNEIIKHVSNLLGNKWTWPSVVETIKNKNGIENGCYWK
jgi:hypothetical protein